MTEDQIKRMAERFLAWRLPEDFNPDGCIMEPLARASGSLSGTHLLTYTQALAMVGHMVDCTGGSEP